MYTTEMTRTETKPRPRFFDLFQGLTPDFDWDFLPAFFNKTYKVGPANAWMPKMEVYEHEGELVFKADVPGMKKEDIKVYIEEDKYLVLEGERKEEKEAKETSFYRNEVHYGNFYRRFPLPFKADYGLIKATYKDGVLMVNVPIVAEPKMDAKTVAVY
jgi:HSP20 family protein